MPGGTGARAAPNEAVLQAVEAAAAQGKGMTVAQVTAATGLPTDEVEMEMAALLRGTCGRCVCCGSVDSGPGTGFNLIQRPPDTPPQPTPHS